MAISRRAVCGARHAAGSFDGHKLQRKHVKVSGQFLQLRAGVFNGAKIAAAFTPLSTLWSVGKEQCKQVPRICEDEVMRGKKQHNSAGKWVGK